MNTQQSFQKLIQLVKQLRDSKKGDPWILKQDFRSLAPLTLEETYEFQECVEEQDYPAMCDELGDLLLHIVLYAELADEQNQFNLANVINATLEKQQRRKLDFNNPENISAEEALKLWDQKKLAERKQTSVLGGIAITLPEMIKAVKLQTQAASVGFDWEEPEPIFDKVNEELLEFKEAISNNDLQHMEEELGDILFAITNLARHYQINPETALRKSNQKFIQRFQKIEAILKDSNKDITKCSLEELDSLWEKVKKDPHQQS